MISSMIQPIVEHVLNNKVGYVAPFILVGLGMGIMEYQIKGLENEVKTLNKRGLIEYVITLDEQLCRNRGDIELLQLLAEAIQEYHEVSGKNFPVPIRCAGVLPEVD